MSARANPATWTVDDDGPADFNNIQEAMSIASSGDTIFVCVGTYYEHVVINKSIALVGESRDLTIIDGNNTGTAVTIKSYNVTVRDLTIQRGSVYPSSGIFIGGIFVNHSMGNTITNNRITDNSEGVSLYSSSGNLICANILSNNSYGVSLYSSGNNLISGNTILGNNVGIGLFFSSNNAIYHNNFNNNTSQVWIIDSINVWSYGGEGNYWIDYAGQDLDKDGIGDSFHIIDESNQDNYPLMGMFFDFNVSFKEIYSVTVISNSTISDFGFEIGAETGNKILRLNVVGKNGTVAFCRVKIPIELMKYPYAVLIDAEDIVPTLLDVSNETYACLYFSFHNQNRTIRIIYSETLHLYLRLQTDFYDLNRTYYSLLESYNTLLGNYTQLQLDFETLNNSYRELYDLNMSYYSLLESYNALLGNYTQLQISFHELNNSFLEHQTAYSKQLWNVQNLTQIFAVITAVFILTTIYLSKRTHEKVSIRTEVAEEQ